MADRPDILMSFWIGGVNSLLHPTTIAKDQYPWGENVVNRGGIIQTRPGYGLKSGIVGEKLQGMAMFTPDNSEAQVIMVVDGQIYRGVWPFFNFDKIEGLSPDPGVPDRAPLSTTNMVHFCECLQSVRRKEDLSIEKIEPKRVLMIGDGENPMVWYDGLDKGRLFNVTPRFETPIGSWMVWANSVLWVACGSKVRASDIGNPFNFIDDESAGTASKFEMPAQITGMIATTSRNGLLVFTEGTTTVIQSGVRPRTSWQTTPEFVKLLLPEIGCTSGKAVVNQYGMTFWPSLAGIVSLDSALNTDKTSRLLTIDSQMMRSKRSLSSDLSWACGATFENLLFFSLPSGGKHNEHTWVMDQSPVENMSQAGVWVGIWTGTRPVQWASGRIGGMNRLLYASYDRSEARGTRIHLWEAIRDDRTDQGGPIACQVQLPTIASPKRVLFKYAELDLEEILGKVTLSVFVSGVKGGWYLLDTYEIRAQEGSMGAPGQLVINNESILREFKPQSRTIKTREFSDAGLGCTPETAGLKPGRDKGFGLLLEWRGRMGVRAVRLVMSPDSSDEDKGKCAASEEGQINIVTESGETL